MTLNSYLGINYLCYAQIIEASEFIERKNDLIKNLSTLIQEIVFITLRLFMIEVIKRIMI